MTKADKRYCRSAKRIDFDKMVVAASAVVIQNRGNQYRTGDPEYVLFEFPSWVKFEESFPKGFIVSKTLKTNTYKVNAVKLLDWLHANKHSSYDSSMLVKQTKHYEIFDKGIDKMFDLDS